MIKNLTDVQFDQSINLAEEEILFILIETNRKNHFACNSAFRKTSEEDKKSAIIINTHLPG